MRFDLTCNVALRVVPGQRLHAHVLPALTEQQHLLNEVIWVEGCEHWATSRHPNGRRALDLVACEGEVRVAFAASLTLAPVWCHIAALWEQPSTGFKPPRAYTKPCDQWSRERIAEALGRALPGPSAVFAALPELFEWLRQSIDSNDFRRYARVPVESTHCARDCRLEPLEFAIAVFRALGVPARSVAGFAPEFAQPAPHDARAFNLELYRGGRWWLFEPDGQVPAFGFIRTAVAPEPGDLALLQGSATAKSVRMDVDVDPPPAWGLPLRSSSRLLLSLDAEHTSSASSRVVATPAPAAVTWG